MGCGGPPAHPAPDHLSFVLTLDSMFPKAALLLGLTVVGIHVWIIQKELVDISKDNNYFAVSVEFAVAWFNSDHEEEHADRLLEVRQPSKMWVAVVGPGCRMASPEPAQVSGALM